jgi:hypothetical protein
VSPRVPFVVLLTVAVSGAVVAGRAGDETPTAAPAPAEPGVQMPAVPPADVLASTWYCAAGTAEAGGMADHTVVVLNPGEDAVAGSIDVYSGAVASTAPAGDGGPAAGGEAPADAEDEGKGGTAAAPEAGGNAEDGGEGGEPGVGDAWAGAQAHGAAAAAAPAAREDIRVPARGRVEVRLADLEQSPLASALVELDGPAVVEHEVAGDHGRDLAPCASTASPDWYLAWGVTSRDARELLVLFNPFPGLAVVDIVFSTDDGPREPVRYQGIPVPPGAVVGVDIGVEVTRREQVSTTVRSRTGPVVVERLQTFDGSAGVEGLSLALGAPSPLETWAFAYGRRAPGRGERIVLYNPSDERAEVDVAVVPGGAADEAVPPPQPFGVTIAGGRYEILDYAEEDRIPADAGYATVVRSRNGVPVVAERVLTFTAGRTEGDVAAGGGAAMAARSWTFATLGSGRDPSSRLMAYNPDPDRPVRLSVTGLVDGREVAPGDLQDLEVPADSPRGIELPAEIQGSASALVVEAEGPVVVERLVATADGLPQAVGPGLPGSEGAEPLSRIVPGT